jgi:hypothetical protein
MKTSTHDSAYLRVLRFFLLLAPFVPTLLLPVHAQSPALQTDFRFEHLSGAHGLSVNTVTSIAQDDTGFMWFGTVDGLNRFDDYTFRVFKQDPSNQTSLSNNYVETMWVDRRRDLWLGTANGLNRFDHDTDRFTRYLHDPNVARSLADNHVESIFEDRSGLLWAGTRQGLNRLERDTGQFILIEACLKVGVPAGWLDKAKPSGPLAEFDGADTWVEHPYRQGVVLIGDAASTNDPAWGNGLSLTLRDVRVLRDKLLSDDDWDRAAGAYATEQDQYFAALRRVTRWRADLMYEVGPDAEARRAKALPLFKEDRTRVPDYIALGPDSPSDETARRRYYCED